jgi:hypothetical protein
MLIDVLGGVDNGGQHWHWQIAGRRGRQVFPLCLSPGFLLNSDPVSDNVLSITGND